MRVRQVSLIYLLLVPLCTLVIAFAFGHLSPIVYVPVWILHSCLMALAASTLGRYTLEKNKTAQEKSVVMAACFIVVAWIFISIFFGFGPPPETPAGWIDRLGEQKIRYTILIFAGILTSLAFTIFRDALKYNSKDSYSRIGVMIVSIAAPLFILNMAFWGSYLGEAFKIFVYSGITKRPDWYAPIKALFGEISAIEVALFYLATAIFAMAFKEAGWFRTRAVILYILFCLIGIILDLMPTGNIELLVFANYFVSIPAIPFVMPYLMAVHLLATPNE